MENKEHSFRLFQKDLKEDKLKGRILMCGKEEYLISWAKNTLIKKYISDSMKDMNLVELDIDEVTNQIIEENLLTPPFFSEKRIVVINNIKTRDFSKLECLENINMGENILLLLSNEDMKKPKVVNFYYNFDRLDKREVSKFINKRFKSGEISISSPMITTLINHTEYLEKDREYDLYNLMSDIDKLIAYTKSVGDGSLTLEHIKAIMPPTMENDIFKLLDAISRNNKEVALQILNNMLYKGEREHSILAMIVGQLEILLQIKELAEHGFTIEEMTSKTKIHKFRVQKAVNSVRSYDRDRLKSMLVSAYGTDMRIKRGLLQPHTAMELLIGEL